MNYYNMSFLVREGKFVKGIRLVWLFEIVIFSLMFGGSSRQNFHLSNRWNQTAKRCYVMWMFNSKIVELNDLQNDSKPSIQYHI